MSSNSPSSWHTVAIDKTLQQLSSNKDAGLSSQQVSERLQQYGPNELEETGGRSPWSIFVDQFTNIMLLMLMGAGRDFGFFGLSGRILFPKMRSPFLRSSYSTAFSAFSKSKVLKKPSQPSKTLLRL
jgi:Ca2+-transporting ATPase